MGDGQPSFANAASLHYAGSMTAKSATTVADFRAVRDAALRMLPDAQLLYVFGSHARGVAGASSDLDLAVLAGAAIDPLRLFSARQSLELALGTDVDLVDLAAAGSVLRMEVVRDGVLLYEHGAEQALAFESRVLGEYAELMDATRALRADIHQRGTVYAT